MTQILHQKLTSPISLDAYFASKGIFCVNRESEESTCSQKWLHVVLGRPEPPGGRGGRAGENYDLQMVAPWLGANVNTFSMWF